MKDQSQLKGLKLSPVQQDKIVEEEILERSIKQRAAAILSGITLDKKIRDLESGSKLDDSNINSLTVSDIFKVDVKDTKKIDALDQLKDQYSKAKQDIQDRFEDKVLKIRQGDDLLPSVMKMVKVFVAIKED